ncbi:MAG: YihY/virulence factor BrkB family protein [Pseudobdellovibrionaceae bacterium]
MKSIRKLASDAFEHDIFTLAAALAFYSALSLAPLLLVTIFTIGLIGIQAQNELLEQVRILMGIQASEAIAIIIQSTGTHPNLNSAAGIVGILTLLFSASAVFGQLQSSLNVIGGGSKKKIKSEVWDYVKKRFFSIGLVLAFAFLAMVSLIANALITMVLANTGDLLKLTNFFGSLAIFALLFALIFFYLPDNRVNKRAALWGGLITATLFTIGKHFIGLYLGSSAIGSAYGAAGSLIILLVWVYYSSIILFLGAEITYVLGETSNTTIRAHSVQ